MHIQIPANQLVLMARMPMPPSINHAKRAGVRERKDYSAADYLAGKKPYYGTTYTDPKADLYKQEALWMLRCPCPPQWQSWQEPMAVRALRENTTICLDFELWEFFADNKSDADNRVKGFQDILAEHLDIDDKRIIEGKQHKRVIPGCTPYAVAKLRVAEVTDAKAEQAELDDMLVSLTEEKNYGSFTEIRAFASSPTIADAGAARR